MPVGRDCHGRHCGSGKRSRADDLLAVGFVWGRGSAPSKRGRAQPPQKPLTGCGKTLIRAGFWKGTTSQAAEKLGFGRFWEGGAIFCCWPKVLKILFFF